MTGDLALAALLQCGYRQGTWKRHEQGVDGSLRSSDGVPTTLSPSIGYVPTQPSAFNINTNPASRNMSLYGVTYDPGNGFVSMPIAWWSKLTFFDRDNSWRMMPKRWIK